MNTSSYISVIVIVIVITDSAEYVSSRLHTLRPGNRLLRAGDTLIIRCKLTRKPCHSIKRKGKIFEFIQKDQLFNSTVHVKKRKGIVRIYCKNSSVVVLKIRKITKESEGLYGCGKRLTKNNSVSVRIGDIPINISCIFHGKRKLSCTYSVDGGNDISQYTCYAIERHLGKSNDILSGVCPQSLTTVGLSNTTEKGVCRYRCGNTDCIENMMLIVVWRDTASNKTKRYCHVAKLDDLRKPGPVRNLHVHNITSTSVSVSWTKPDDLNNEDDVYTYTVHWVGEDGEKNNSQIADKKPFLSLDITDLKPCWQYDVTVAAKPKRAGFYGTPSTAKITTDESVPVSGPIVPVGSFSVQGMRYLGIYWQIMPKEQRRGVIVHYEVVTGNRNNTTKENWTKVELPETASYPVIVTLRAATKIGYSRQNTTVIITRDMLVNQRAIRVSRKRDEIVWKLTDGITGRVRVHRCYGAQFNAQTQLVRYKTQIEYRDVYDTTTNHLKWSNPPPPSVSCEKCQWHYAVSVHLNNDTAGMVWSTEHHVTPSDQADALIAVVSLPVATLFATVIILMRKKLTLKRYVVSLPKLSDDPRTSHVDKCTYPVAAEGKTQPLNSGLDIMGDGYDINPNSSLKQNNEDEHMKLDTTMPVDVDLIGSSSGDMSLLSGRETEPDDWTGALTQASGDDFGEWLQDESDGSVVSDYRMQFVSVSDVKEEAFEEENWDEGDGDDVVSTMLFEIKSDQQDASSMPPAFKLPQRDSKASATSYSEVAIHHSTPVDTEQHLQHRHKFDNSRYSNHSNVSNLRRASSLLSSSSRKKSFVVSEFERGGSTQSLPASVKCVGVYFHKRTLEMDQHS